jgi:hypothetical protein
MTMMNTVCQDPGKISSPITFVVHACID